MASPINILPTELCRIICSHLPREDLRSMHLASRFLSYSAKSVLFRTVFLKVNSQSYIKLRRIAENKDLQKQVRTIEYDGSVLNGSLLTREFNSWLDNGAATGFGLGEIKRKQFLAQFSKTQLKQYHLRYLQWLLDQEKIIADDNEFENLEYSLKCFARLVEIRFHNKGSRNGCHFTNEFPRLSSLSFIAQQILAEPMHSYREYTFSSPWHFAWPLLEAAQLTGCVYQIKSIGGTNMDQLTYFQMSNAFNIRLESFSGLRTISLEFSHYFSGHYMAKHLSEVLASTPSMESIHLDFKGCSLQTPVYNIPLSTLIRSKWSNLKSLSLGGITATQMQWEELLLAHFQTLRFLRLSNIILSSDGFTTKSDCSWVSFISFLGKHMALKDVEFNGVLANGWNELWMTDAEYRSNKQCLMLQIQHFITQGGPFPFLYPTDKERFNVLMEQNCGVPWEFIDDNSWSLMRLSADEWPELAFGV